MPVNKNSLQKKRGALNRDGALGPANLGDALRYGRYCYENFMEEPSAHMVGTLTAPGGTALSSCVVDTGRYRFLFATTQDETDQFFPKLATGGGYNFVTPTTPVLSDGTEVNFGSDVLGHPRTYVPSSEECFARIYLSTDDASGADIVFGFKKVAATVASLTEITDMATIRILGDDSSTSGAFTIVTQANSDGTTDYTSTTTTVTGLEDATGVELEVRAKGGKAYFFVNGAQVAGSPSFTFDSGDYVTPFLRIIQTTDIANELKVHAFECGLLEDRTDATLASMKSSTL